MILKPLGTVSPYPKNNHNCPDYLVTTEKEKILLDCGNGITRLLSFPEDLQGLNIIISHYHKDHIGDVGAIQYASYVFHNLGLLKDKVKIYLPTEDFQNIKKSIIETKESYLEYHEIENKFQVGDIKVKTCDNKSHSIESYMIRLEKNGESMVYTGDVGTSNMDEIISFSKESDLLLSESSFLEEHHTKSTAHLTTLDAARITKLANCKKLVLTHLWPEENRNKYLQEAKSIFSNSEMAEEGKKIYVRRGLNG